MSKMLAVAMPHAALWVVQRRTSDGYRTAIWGFNAARGFVGGADLIMNRFAEYGLVSMPHAALWVVQLRRSQPLSPRGKKPFWKVSGNLSVLTENM